MKKPKTKNRFQICKRHISDRQMASVIAIAKGVSGTTIDMTIFI